MQITNHPSEDGFKLVNMNYKQSIVGSTIAFIVATSCCWLPALVIGLGGASGLLAFANGLEQFSGVFMAIGFIALIYGGYLYNKRKSSNTDVEVQLVSTITCPKCEHCLLYTSPSPRDQRGSRMPSSA